MDQYPDAVLFDRDGTLIEDVPYNGDPAKVEPMPGAREVLCLLRAHGVRTGVVSNQSGVGRGLITGEQVAAVNARVEVLLGRFGTWQVCPHAPDDGCSCRKPLPGMVIRACEALDARPERTYFIGDIEADVKAGLAAGVTPIMVPTPVTLADEVDRAPHTARDLRGALAMIL
ncbi:HAD-IIIA family hydrolase [Saccharothrix longispora]|uniref:D-glycero-alpha-D-manno-heptose-1,7-bisphosphate 7-phosphatase n=1 Tax=Saccharothrix longispora TaxID=33920 RepID=UPI0028FDBE2B|nr:HAD-IIIA family hydrolase [Saccharothrix longispora]MBY8851943.1 HAD-IIIA family hydrolase [Saccharothrix sp. MB29]MDU0289167.1 HAD-IIIA family hydrolase [Saccharothrix longispora]